MDAETGQILAAGLTTSDVDEGSQVSKDVTAGFPVGLFLTHAGIV